MGGGTMGGGGGGVGGSDAAPFIYIYIYAHPPPSTDPGSEKKAEGATDSVAAHSSQTR